MRLSRLLTVAVVVAALCWLTCIMLLALYYGKEDLIRIWQVFSDSSAYTPQERLIYRAPLFILLFMVLGLAGTIIFAVLCFRQFLLPLRRAEKFAAAVARGENVPPLPQTENFGVELQNLGRSLNMLHDRQQNLVTKLRQRSASDLAERQQRENFDAQKLLFFGELLPESRRSIGILKGQRLVQLLRLESQYSAEAEAARELLHKSIARLEEIGGDLEMVMDISSLDWERWNNLRNDTFDSAELVHELLENNRLSSRTRQVHLACQISSELPGQLKIDRELLLQLLSILIRSACRAARKGSDILLECARDDRGEASFLISFPLYKLDPIGIVGAFGSPDPDRQWEYRSGNSLVLALEIVRNTAKLIGVSLTVEAPREDTLRFALSLPGGASLYDAGGFSALPNHPFYPQPTARKAALPILLWDDDAESTEVLVELMKFYDLELLGADSLAACRKLLETQSFSAAVVSNALLDDDAAELIGKLREIPGGNLPTIFASPVVAEKIRRQLASFDDVWCLPMPINFELLAELLRRVRR